MAYVLSPAGDPLAIAEYQYATAAAVTFTGFSSCIGVLGLNADGTQIGAIHLVIMDPQGNLFANADAQTVAARVQQMGLQVSSLQIWGSVDTWRGSIPDAFRTLLAALGNPPTHDEDDGTLGATLVSGAIRVARQ